jgi:dihydroflavonol-4-reductase
MDKKIAEKKETMKALVTGANGFVGSHLVEGLLSKGYQVTCLVRKTSNLRWLSGLDVKYVYADLSEKDTLRNVLKGIGFVFHVAGLTKKYSCLAKSREEYFKANCQGTQNLIETCFEENSQIKRFVYISTQAVMGPGKDVKPLDETSTCNPITDYGKSKLEGERIVLKHSSQLPVTIIRPPALYGPRDPDFLIIFRMVNKGFKPLLGKGESFINLCYIEDLIDGIILAAESPKAIGQIYFIADDQVYSRKKIPEIMAQILNKRTITLRVPNSLLFTVAFISQNMFRLLGKPVLLNTQKVREISQKYWLCDISKAKKELGFSPKYNLEDGARKTVRWYKEKGWL